MSKKIEFVSTRLKQGKELYDTAYLRKASDVFRAFHDTFENLPDGAIGVASINTQGQVINVQFTSMDEFPQNAMNILGNAALSNAASLMLLSNTSLDEDVRKLTATFEKTSKIYGIPLIEHLTDMNRFFITL